MTLIQFRRGTAANWTAANTELASGEFGFETDTRKFKIGPGNWNELDYAVESATTAYLEGEEITFTDEGEGEGYFSVGGVPVSGTLVPPAATWSGVAAKPIVFVEDHGAVGDGTTNDTTAFTEALAALGDDPALNSTVLRNAYLLDDVTVANVEVRGDHAASAIIKAVTDVAITLGDNSALRNVTIDGQEMTPRSMVVDGNNIVIDGVRLVDARQCFRATDGTSYVLVTNVRADASKVWNTDDAASIRGCIFTNIISTNGGPFEAFLIDQPDAEPEWTGFILGPSIWEHGEDSEHAISLAKCVGGVVLGHVFYGDTSATYFNDCLHFEDGAELLNISGSVFETNGALKSLDAGIADGNAPVTDILVHGNLHRATLEDTNELISFTGSQAYGSYHNMTVRDETLLCGNVAEPGGVLTDSAVVGHHAVFDATASPYVSSINAADGSSYHSRTGAQVVRLPNYQVNPHYLRSFTGHGFNPDNVIFRTSFGFDTYANFAAWAETVKSVTGATIASFAGSTGGGSITFVTDPDSGALLLRATRGASAMTARMDLVFDVHDIDLQQFDCLAVRVMTKSSVQTGGVLHWSNGATGTGVSAYTQVLNDGADYADWKSDGASITIPADADFYAGGNTMTLQCQWGASLASEGDTCDWGLLAVSHNRATPF